LILVLQDKEFLVDWLADIDLNLEKLGFDGCIKMMNALAKAIYDWHHGTIPANYDDLIHFLGIDERASVFYLN